MKSIIRFAALWLVVLSASALVVAAPAHAAKTTNDYRAELDAIALDMRALAGEIERFQIQQRYCLPPYAPLKQPDMMLMAAYSARTEALNDKYNALKQSLKSFLATNTRLHAELMIQGKDPTDAGWWSRWDNSRDKMVSERNAKRDALAKAPERDCTPRAKPAIAVQPPPPLALPTPPVIPSFDWPALPPHFCSELEKLNWKIANINPQYLREAEIAHEVARYRSQIEGLVNDHVQADKPIPPALAQARQRAIALSREMERIEKANAAFYRRFAAIPVIDCSTKPPKDPPPPQPPLRDRDAQRVAGQQDLIQRVENLIHNLDRARAENDCVEVDRLEEQISKSLVEMGGLTIDDGDGKRPAFPPDLIRQFRERSRSSATPCPPTIEKKEPIRDRVPQSDCPPESILDDIDPPDPRMKTILQEHNKHRARIGVQPLRWNVALAGSAQAYANQLAKTEVLRHSPREGRGAARENLNQGMLGWSALQMIANWVNEESNFRPGVFPDISKTGRWEDAAHYSQMVWPKTTEIGCGLADGMRSQWLVCHYTPGGNKDGTFITNDPAVNRANGPCIADETAPRGSPPLFDPRDLVKMPVGGGMTQIDPPAGTPPPPPPTASDPAPDGDEMRHPLRGYFLRAHEDHQRALAAGDLNGQAEALAKMYYALQELMKRMRDARKLPPEIRRVDPAKVKELIDLLNRLYRAANEASRPKGERPSEPRQPRDGEERG